MALPNQLVELPDCQENWEFISSRLFWGIGTPLNVVKAVVGAVYFRLDGGAGTTLYVKESGAGDSTGWVAK